MYSSLPSTHFDQETPVPPGLQMSCSCSIPSEQPALYRGQHQKEYELHITSIEALKELGVKALPKPEKLDAQIEKLEAEQATARDEWKKLRKQQDIHLHSENVEEQIPSAPDISQNQETLHPAFASRSNAVVKNNNHEKS